MTIKTLTVAALVAIAAATGANAQTVKTRTHEVVRPHYETVCHDVPNGWMAIQVGQQQDVRHYEPTTVCNAVQNGTMIDRTTTTLN